MSRLARRSSSAVARSTLRGPDAWPRLELPGLGVAGTGGKRTGWRHVGRRRAGYALLRGGSSVEGSERGGAHLILETRFSERGGER